MILLVVTFETQDEVNAEVPYDNGPNSYWVKREVCLPKYGLLSSFLSSHWNYSLSFLPRPLLTQRCVSFHSIIIFDADRDWTQEVDVEVPYENGPKSYWVKREVS